MALQLRARRIEHIQLEEKETTSKKRSASAAPSARIREFEGPKAKAASAKPIPPRPQRDPPRFVLQAHEVRVGDELDTDWTRSKEWGRELKLCEERNELIKAQLLEGKTAAYRQSGWSLYPRIYSNDICCYTPVTFDESVEEEDIVFCEVQPTRRFYAHLVKTKEWSDDWGCWVYWISNLKGRVNGWCRIEHIHGKLFQVWR